MSESIVKYSDDEVCTGDLTLNEIKTHINKLRRETIAYDKTTFEECNDSLKIIEVHSTPNVVSLCNSNLSPALSKAELSPNLVSKNGRPSVVIKSDHQDSDESFLELEKMIANLCCSPGSNNYIDMNALEAGVKCDLNSGATHDAYKCEESNTDEIIKDLYDSEITPQLHKLHNVTKNTSACKTPCRDNIETNSKFTQTGNGVPKTPNFKTPGKFISPKKNTVTPMRKPYQHIVSPVAAYIRKCPTVPLLQNVRPKKPILATSSIPKLVKTISKSNVNNKENSALPVVAYRTAKETKLIEVPDEQRLPKSQWAKRVASSIPNAFVIKHSHQHGSSTKKPLKIQQEDSFNDISLHQADVSVCTKKSAFNNLKNK